ncbi:MAG: toxin [Candidatus Omnitrophica bacterium]|nr:toxin [Candidatus Omnitrophota bacterium]
MKPFDWDDTKSKALERERGICFEDIVIKIEEGFLLDNIDHPNKIKYAHQGMLVVNVDGYVYGVPYVEEENTIHLITVFPSRKLTKIYLGGEA